MIKPDLAVDNEFATHIPGSYNEKIPLLYEIIMDVFHHSMLCEDTRLFHDDMKQLWHAFFESPDSMALLRNKCAEMKGIDSHYLEVQYEFQRSGADITENQIVRKNAGGRDK